MIKYVDNLTNIEPRMLEGFFVGWPKHPDKDTHYRLLAQSTQIVLAVDAEKDRVVGFINAISDCVLSAYIPLLEVLPDYQKRGIGRELVERLMKKLGNLYMVDLVCDKDLEKFYRHFGFRLYHAMMYRNFDRQDGRAE